MGFGYMIFCTLPGISTVYFGITSKTVEKRFKEHLYKASVGYPQYLHNAIRKYGAENFQVQQMYTNDDFEKCKQWEIDTITSSRKIGLKLWNLTDGGQGGNGYKWSEESRQKMSRSKTGKTHRGSPLSEEHKLKLSIAHKGKPSPKRGIPMSEEQKIKLSIAHKGKPSPKRGVPLSEEHRQKIAIINRSRTISPETRAKMADSLRGRKLSEESKRKISVARKGIPWSEETRIKMVEVYKKRKTEKLLAEQTL
jgi:group I intron endonuclease